MDKCERHTEGKNIFGNHAGYYPCENKAKYKVSFKSTLKSGIIVTENLCGMHKNSVVKSSERIKKRTGFDVELKIENIILVITLLLTLNLSSQVQFTHFKDLDSFDKHRVVTTGMAWTGTIIGYKATGKIWKGALIGLGCALSAGISKEAYDMTGRGVPSWSDMGGNLMGSLVGTVAGSMCCGLAQHIRDKKEVERAYKFYNPITF